MEFWRPYNGFCVIIGVGKRIIYEMELVDKHKSTEDAKNGTWRPRWCFYRGHKVFSSITDNINNNNLKLIFERVVSLVLPGHKSLRRLAVNRQGPQPKMEPEGVSS